MPERIDWKARALTAEAELARLRSGISQIVAEAKRHFVVLEPSAGAGVRQGQMPPKMPPIPIRPEVHQHLAGSSDNKCSS